jgi:pimeloyl-ACP methyl ester carboxylesterase
MPYADLGDIRVYYEEYGIGIPVVFLHGLTLDRRMWAPQVEPFASHYRVILVDSRGHGLSEAPVTGYSRDQRVEDLRKLADLLKLDRFHLVGLSMGGSTAIGMALKYQPRLRSLILVSTGAAGYNYGKDFGRFPRMAHEQGIEAALRAWRDMTLVRYTGSLAGIRSQMAAMINDHTGAVWSDSMIHTYPRTNDLDNVHTIAVPTCIIVGEQDRVFVPLSEELYARIVGSQLHIVKDAGHLLNLEQPEEFNRLLATFLESV